MSQLRAMRRRARVAARYDSDATHRSTKSVRRYAALDIETPTPVPTAMYAARHAGHFGSNASVIPGRPHRTTSSQRREVAGGFSPARLSGPFAGTLQQR